MSQIKTKDSEAGREPEGMQTGKQNHSNLQRPLKFKKYSNPGVDHLRSYHNLGMFHFKIHPGGTKTFGWGNFLTGSKTELQVVTSDIVTNP